MGNHDYQLTVLRRNEIAWMNVVHIGSRTRSRLSALTTWAADSRCSFPYSRTLSCAYETEEMLSDYLHDLEIAIHAKRNTVSAVGFRLPEEKRWEISYGFCLYYVMMVDGGITVDWSGLKNRVRGKALQLGITMDEAKAFTRACIPDLLHMAFDD